MSEESTTADPVERWQQAIEALNRRYPEAQIDAARGTAERLAKVRALDEERVPALFRRSGRGRVIGLEIADLAGSEGADVLHIRDGKVIRYLTYWQRDRALADLGLEE